MQNWSHHRQITWLTYFTYVQPKKSAAVSVLQHQYCYNKQFPVILWKDPRERRVADHSSPRSRWIGPEILWNLQRHFLFLRNCSHFMESCVHTQQWAADMKLQDDLFKLLKVHLHVFRGIHGRIVGDPQHLHSITLCYIQYMKNRTET